MLGFLRMLDQSPFSVSAIAVIHTTASRLVTRWHDWWCITEDLPAIVLRSVARSVVVVHDWSHYRLRLLKPVAAGRIGRSSRSPASSMSVVSEYTYRVQSRFLNTQPDLLCLCLLSVSHAPNSTNSSTILFRTRHKFYLLKWIQVQPCIPTSSILLVVTTFSCTTIHRKVAWTGRATIVRPLQGARSVVVSHAWLVARPVLWLDSASINRNHAKTAGEWSYNRYTTIQECVRPPATFDCCDSILNMFGDLPAIDFYRGSPTIKINWWDCVRSIMHDFFEIVCHLPSHLVVCSRNHCKEDITEPYGDHVHGVPAMSVIK